MTAAATHIGTVLTCQICYPYPCGESSHRQRRTRTPLDVARAEQWGTKTEPDGLKSESSNLGAWEINVEIPRTDNLAQLHRFRNHLPERNAWLELLPKIEQDRKRLERFQNCGSTAWIFRHNETGEVRLQSNACKLRVCPICRRARQARAARLLGFMLEGAEPREFQMITLTLRHNNDPLADRLRFLRSCFRKLRQRNCWKKAADFGYAVLEINWSSVTGCWHPHLHVIVKCQYIDWSVLRKDWTQITRGSHSVNSRIIERPGGAAHYLVKYLGKPPDATILESAERATEYYRAIDRAKLILPFGKPPHPPEPVRSLHVSGDWTSVSSLTAVLIKARQCDHDSMQLLEDLLISRQKTERYFHHIDNTNHDYADHSRAPP